MKNKKGYILVTVCLCVAAIVASAFFSAMEQQKKSIKTPMVERVAAGGYVIRLEGDSVNVYTVTSEGETYNRSVANINVYDLPETVRQNLKTGVTADDDAQLAGIIENLSS